MVCVSDHVLHTKVINKASVTRICNSLLNRRGIPVMPTVCYASEMENVHPVAIFRMMWKRMRSHVSDDLEDSHWVKIQFLNRCDDTGC